MAFKVDSVVLDVNQTMINNGQQSSKQIIVVDPQQQGSAQVMVNLMPQ